MADKLLKISEKLRREIKILMNEIQELGFDIENEIEEYKDNYNDSHEKRLQKQETWYDKAYERYVKCEKILKNDEFIHQMITDYQNNMQQYFRSWEKKKKQIANQLNSFLEKMTQFLYFSL